MNNTFFIGPKTLKLFDLQSLGLHVPPFRSIDAKTLQKHTNEKGEIHVVALRDITKEIVSFLQCERYAVRSSALIEDSDKESFAGQFKTLINISEDGLELAIQEVTTHAYEFLSGRIEKFSLLIQEYIEPDISGVTFTRNPLGGREMIIEYHEGKGEEIVGGKGERRAVME